MTIIPRDTDLESFQLSLQASEDQVVLDEFYYSRAAAALTRQQEAALRREISRHFDVAMRDVIVTGSANLGFTLVPKPGRPSFSPFGEGSDIDIAIISTPLYVRLWKDVNEYIAGGGQWDREGAFRKYFMRGWLRPDKLPSGGEFPSQAAWFEYFRELTNSGAFGPYKIAAGVYYDETFWEQYASAALLEARTQLETPL